LLSGEEITRLLQGHNQLWDRLVEDCPVAVCKANYMATAYHCLQAAYLKAHHPAEFRAVLQLATG